MVFARRLPQLEVEIEAGRLQVIVDGLYQVFPDPDRYFMAFPQYFLFTLTRSYIRDVATAPPTMGPEVIR